MQRILTFCCSLFIWVQLSAQTQLFVLDFETPGGYTTTTPEFINSSNSNFDYFIRTDGSNIGGVSYTNSQGSWYFGAQDLDGTGGSALRALSISGISIAGYNSLEFRVFLAEDDDGTNEDWDANDYVHFNYQIDAGGYNNLLWIENDGSQFNSAPFIDTDFDGDGDGTEITDAFTQFTQTIAGTGAALDIQIEFFLDAGDEDIAIDHIEVYGVVACTPPVVNSFYPTEGPDSTIVTISGSGFNTGTGVNSVQFGTQSAHVVSFSATEIKAVVPAGVSSNDIIVTVNNCPASITGFNYLQSTPCVSNSISDIIISELFDSQSGNTHYLEIYNGTGATVDLSTYSIAVYNNGNSSATWTAALSGTITNNSTLLYNFGSTGSLPVTSSFGNTGVNDNDCIRLLKNGSPIDVIGDCSGTNWVINGNVGYSYIRQSTITSPSTSFNSADWIAFDPETQDSLGAHTFNQGPPPTSITTQPTTDTICDGDPVSFQVTTTGGSPTYQWKEVSGTNATFSNVSNGGIYTGATSATLNVSPVNTALDGNQYYVEITNGSCVLRSRAVQLYVEPKPITSSVFHN